MLTKVQSYTSNISEWRLITSSPELRSIPFANKLYLAGRQTKIREWYDLEQNEWRKTAPMIGRIMECCAVIMNG